MSPLPRQVGRCLPKQRRRGGGIEETTAAGMTLGIAVAVYADLIGDHILTRSPLPYRFLSG